MTRKSPKPAMSLEEIARAEGATVRAVSELLRRALRKLRAQKLIFTARELAAELARNRKGIVE
jgi:DNA-binding CsgD family transcriptional regulator